MQDRNPPNQKQVSAEPDSVTVSNNKTNVGNKQVSCFTLPARNAHCTRSSTSRYIKSTSQITQPCMGFTCLNGCVIYDAIFTSRHIHVSGRLHFSLRSRRVKAKRRLKQLNKLSKVTSAYRRAYRWLSRTTSERRHTPSMSPCCTRCVTTDMSNVHPATSTGSN